MRLAACAKEPYSPPSWVTDQLEGVEQALANCGRSPAMEILVDSAQLEPAAEELLWTLATASVEARAHAHLVSALGSEIRRGLSVGAYAALANLDDAGSRAMIALLDPRHALFRHRLVETTADRLDAATPLTVPRRVIDHLAGRDAVDPWLSLASPSLTARFDARQRAVLDQVRDALAPMRNAVIVIEGPRGAGRASAAAFAATELRREVVVLDGASVPPTVVDRQRALAALHREVLLRGDAVPLIANVDAWTDADAWYRAVSRFAREQRGAVVLTSGTGNVELAGDVPVVRFMWDVGDHATRHALWRDALGHEFADRDHEIRELAHRYRLGPGGIERAVRSAQMLAASEGEPLRVHDIVLGVRSNIAERLKSLARRIDVVESWDDLVLPTDAHDTIRALINRCRFGHRVYEEWGFKRRASRGTGVAALFSGPPGTGKTMVAGLIARELELELYQIDLSQVVSKWIGETEKNLGQLFEAAEAGHALLLFDEADSLFAKRSSKVDSAQDRYANLEVNYLLQRIEAFSGIAILTTNLDTSIDAALKRRLAAHVLFFPPDEEERAKLWERMATSGDAPVECTRNDFTQLSREFPDMTGAHIRNAVLAAAFVAASEGGTITRNRLSRAAQLEYRSMGRVLATRL
jgi:hypothetical protein